MHDHARATGRAVGVVLELKHATYFEDLGRDVARLVADELRDAGWARGEHPLSIESFESTVLSRVREGGIVASYVYLLDDVGSPYDLLAAQGGSAPTYAQTASPAGLDALVGRFEGISVAKSMILAPLGPSLVAQAHARGLEVFTWTCRPENTFLDERFRRGDDPAGFGDYEGEWAVIRDAGVDGVFVDHPDLGVEFFRP